MLALMVGELLVAAEAARVEMSLARPVSAGLTFSCGPVVVYPSLSCSGNQCTLRSALSEVSVTYGNITSLLLVRKGLSSLLDHNKIQITSSSRTLLLYAQDFCHLSNEMGGGPDWADIY